MKKQVQKIGLAAAAGMILFASCSKQNMTPSHPESTTTPGQTSSSTAQKSNVGLNVIALRCIPGSNLSEYSSAYNMTAGSGSGFQVIYNSNGGIKISNVSGITTIFNNTAVMYGVTNNQSNYPGSLFKINIGAGNATFIGNTTLASGAAIYLQDIERTVDGQYYYAIEAGTKNIYMSNPSAIGNPPLIWKLLATLPVSPSSTSSLHGLDIYNGMLMVYGNGQCGGAYGSVASKIGYYARYNIGASGTLTYVGIAATNIAYSVSSGEDAAFLISNDGGINGGFVMLATPSLSGDHYYNTLPTPPSYAPYINSTPYATATFGGMLPAGTRGLVDYTYYN
jgi:hypothetical protein